MTRKELLDRLRRELDNRDWYALRPDGRLLELEEELDELTDRLDEIRSSYFSTTDDDALAALDNLSASLSYFRGDVGRLFSELTRLTNELRAEIRRLEAGEGPRARTVELPGLEAAREGEVGGNSDESRSEDDEPTSESNQLCMF